MRTVPRTAVVFLSLLLFATAGAAQENAAAPEPATLLITVEPEGADIYLDNRQIGRGSAELSDLRPGSYKVEARLPGYYREIRYIDLAPGAELELELELEPIVGYLYLRSETPGAEVLLGEESFRDFPLELPIGRYTVTVRAFGYEEETRSVVIEPQEQTTLEVSLDPAPFRVENLRPSKRRFNPENPGEVGVTRIRFRVSAPGEGVFQVVDPEGTVLLSREVGPFRSWEQEILWDGSLPGSGDLSDGVYRIELTAEGPGIEEGSLRRVSLATRVTVDRRIRSRYRTLFSGAAGYLYAPLPEPVGPGNAQVTTEGIGYDADGAWRVPLSLGARFGLGLQSEASITLGPVINSRSDESRLAVTAAFGRRYAYPGRVGALGFLVKGSFFSEARGSFVGRDERTAPTGLSVSNPGALYLGPLTVTLTPELHLGPDPVSYRDDPETGVAVWGYLRGGVGLEGPWGSLALSGALRTTPLAEGFLYDGPIALGGEVNLAVPVTPLYFSLILAGDLYPDQGRAILKGGFGAGLLF